ncbi:archease [Candidatus Woesearchaeota archaeon]|nr:archease [Candidatus Woesearchaeota archaeon]
MAYKYIEGITRADVAFEAYGKTLEQMFSSAAQAVEEVQVDVSRIQGSETREIKLENEDIEKLLFDFLSELVYYKDAEQLVFSKFDIKIKDGYTLKGKLTGEKIDFQKHNPKVDVKAITLHMFKVEKTDSGWKCFVIADI